eukprot:Nitzschia sp. Nitz4//scaffold208_size52459//33959//35616//NITZ4_006815-RA/size52459-snap-gene-0.4-mRNA-1//1//CDS//3329541666//698//frame0
MTDLDAMDAMDAMDATATEYPTDSVSPSDTPDSSFFLLTYGQQTACILVNRIASALSIGGSCYIIYCLLGPRREKELKKRLFSRLLLGLSASDALSSFALAMGPWPKPSDNPFQDNFHDGPLSRQSLGNQATCNLQALVIQTFYFSSLFYTASLCLNFLLQVNYRWTESQLRSSVEPWFHGISVFIPFSMAMLAFFFDLYNPSSICCGLTTSPLKCDTHEDLECIRGSNLFLWTLGIQFLPFVVCFFTIVTCMVLIFRAIRRQERAIARYSIREASKHWTNAASTTTLPSPHEKPSSSTRITSSGEMVPSNSTPTLPLPSVSRNLSTTQSMQQQQRYKDSMLAFRKATLYIGVCLAVWMPVFVIASLESFGAGIPFVVWIIRAIMTPIVGLLNSLVYSGILWSAIKGGFRNVVLGGATRSNSSVSSEHHHRRTPSSGIQQTSSRVPGSHVDDGGSRDLDDALCPSSSSVIGYRLEDDDTVGPMAAGSSSLLTVPLDQSSAFRTTSEDTMEALQQYTSSVQEEEGEDADE